MSTRRRASETRTNPFMQGMAPAAAKPVAAVPAARETDDAGQPLDEKLSKYTALLDGETAAAFDELALMARRKLGRKVDKSKLLRALILMAADDAAVRDQMFDVVGRRA